MSARKLCFEGVVKRDPVEGGVWLIVASGGTAYRPLELASAFRKEGLRVKVLGRVVARASIAMLGVDLEIDEIERS